MSELQQKILRNGKRKLMRNIKNIKVKSLDNGENA